MRLGQAAIGIIYHFQIWDLLSCCCEEFPDTEAWPDNKGWSMAGVHWQGQDNHKSGLRLKCCLHLSPGQNTQDVIHDRWGEGGVVLPWIEFLLKLPWRPGVKITGYLHLKLTFVGGSQIFSQNRFWLTLTTFWAFEAHPLFSLPTLLSLY